MKKFLIPLSLLLLLATVLATSAWAGPLEDSLAADAKGDYATELKIIRPLAVQGVYWAQYNLGIMYDQGQGVAQNYAEAVKWYRLAAAQGHASAQFNLGVSYDNGQGVVQDYIRAHMWFNLAAVSGGKEAVKARDIVASKMTSQQIGEAQKRARECQARQFKNCD